MNYIDNKGAEHLAGFLKSNTSLTILNICIEFLQFLVRNSLKDEGTIIIANALNDKNSLTTLNIGQNNVGSNIVGIDGLGTLLEALKKYKKLTCLDYSTLISINLISNESFHLSRNNNEISCIS